MKLSRQYRYPVKAALKHANNQNLDLAFNLLDQLCQVDMLSYNGPYAVNDIFILQRLRHLIGRRLRSEEFTEYMHEWMNKHTND